MMCTAPYLPPEAKAKPGSSNALEGSAPPDLDPEPTGHDIDMHPLIITLLMHKIQAKRKWSLL